jgi:uncharacterized protein YecE (DUF72 family)
VWVVVKIGTSGWQYRHWRAAFYPAEVPTSHWLELYARSFATVEVNNVFYRLPSADVFERWRETTPEGFEMAVKASRFLTHNKRLRDPGEPVARLVERVRHLGPKLGPVLLQLPPTMRVDPARLVDALDCFPKGVRVAVEARHDSWDCEEVWEALAGRGAAWCVGDAPWRRWPVVRTTDWGYLRFHEGRASPRPCYGRRALTTWAERIAETWPAPADVYAYFNNDACACALVDARRFSGLCRRAGLETTRVPARGSVTLCA